VARNNSYSKATKTSAATQNAAIPSVPHMLCMLICTATPGNACNRLHRYVCATSTHHNHARFTS
jgi:hypothetical protein